MFVKGSNKGNKEVKSELEYEGLTQNEAEEIIEEVQSHLNSPNRGFINFKEKMPKKTWEEALTQISQLMQVRVSPFCQKLNIQKVALLRF